MWRGCCARVSKSDPRLTFSSLASHHLFDPQHIFFRIDTHRIEGRFRDMDRDAVFQKTKLLEPFATLQRRLRPFHKLIQRLLAISIEAQMLVVSWAHAIAVMWNRCP